MKPSTRQQLNTDAALVEEHLRRILEAEPGIPERLRQAMAHSLLAGGKRLRPVLLLWSWRALSGSAILNEGSVLDAAAALEMIHTYSLIHDDLPAMDDDRMRRGQPTCHIAFDEATAILAGDALQTLSFQILGRNPEICSILVSELARNAGPAGMAGGQCLDLEAEGRPLTEEMVHDIHGKKTACLISCAFSMGALLAGCDKTLTDQIRNAGFTLGLAFQAADDLLDVTGNVLQLGKTPGKDDQTGKATWVALEGIEAALARTEALGTIGTRALENSLPSTPAAERLLDLVEYLWTRDH